MSLVRARTRRGIGGLGAGTISQTGVSYIDTGGGITPETFQDSCCTGLFGTFETGDACNAFFTANASSFGSETPCSSNGLANLLYPAPVSSVVPVQPPPGSLTPGGSTVFVPVVAGQPNCNGQPVIDSSSAAALLTCQSLQQAVAQNVNLNTQLSVNLTAQCATRKVTCAQNYLQTAPSSDCSVCVLDITNWRVWAIGIGALIGGAVLIKSFA